MLRQITLEQLFMEYSTNESGAYLFTPAGPAAPLQKTCAESVVFWQGPVVTVVEQVFVENATAAAPDGRFVQRMTLLKDADALSHVVQLEVTCPGAISPNRELITRFYTDLDNDVRAKREAPSVQRTRVH